MNRYELIALVEKRTDLDALIVVDAWIADHDFESNTPYQISWTTGDLIVSYKGYDQSSVSWDVNEGPFIECK